MTATDRHLVSDVTFEAKLGPLGKASFYQLRYEFRLACEAQIFESHIRDDGDDGNRAFDRWEKRIRDIEAEVARRGQVALTDRDDLEAAIDMAKIIVEKDDAEHRAAFLTTLLDIIGWSVRMVFHNAAGTGPQPVKDAA